MASDLSSIPSFRTSVLDRSSLPPLPVMSVDVAKVPGSMYLCYPSFSCFCDLPYLRIYLINWTHSRWEWGVAKEMSQVVDARRKFTLAHRALCWGHRRLSGSALGLGFKGGGHLRARTAHQIKRIWLAEQVTNTAMYHGPTNQV